MQYFFAMQEQRMQGVSGQYDTRCIMNAEKAGTTRNNSKGQGLIKKMPDTFVLLTVTDMLLGANI